jgi:hypothetical protein
LNDEKKGMTRFEAVQRFEELVISFHYKKWKELRDPVIGEREQRTLEPVMKWLEGTRSKLDGWLLPAYKLLKELKELNFVYPRNKEEKFREYDFKKEIKTRMTKNSQRIIANSQNESDIKKEDSQAKSRL